MVGRGHNWGICRKCGKDHGNPLKGKSKPYKGKSFEERYGKKRAKEISIKMSLGIKKSYKFGKRKPVRMFGDTNPSRNPKYKEKHRKSVQKKNRPDWRRHQSESLKGRRVGGALKPDQVSYKIHLLKADPNSTYNTPEFHYKLSLGQRRACREGRRHVSWLRYKNNREEGFQSLFELKVADFFFSKNIKYEQYPKIMYGKRSYFLDFYLPEKDLIVEVAGMFGYNLWGYDDKHEVRIKMLKQLRKNYIFLYSGDLRNLENAFEELYKKIDISEIFWSILGEGTEIGQIAAFVRFSGCNIRCLGCDTPYAFKAGVSLNFREILDTLKLFKLKRIFITGGESLTSLQIKDFIEMLKRHNYKVFLQTNGTILNKEVFSLCDFISCDVKTPAFGTKSSDEVIINIYQNYPRKHQFKFVVKDEKDIQFVETEIDRLKIPITSPIILQPFESNFSNNGSEYVKNIKPSFQFLWNYLVNSSFWAGRKVRLLPQLHKLAYGCKRGV